jgi:hypothetical protein
MNLISKIIVSSFIKRRRAVLLALWWLRQIKDAEDDAFNYYSDKLDELDLEMSKKIDSGASTADTHSISKAAKIQYELIEDQYLESEFTIYSLDAAIYELENIS